MIADGTLGTDDFVANTITMYPNPANDNVRIISGNETITAIQISDSKGSVIVSKPINATNTQIRTDVFTSGIYFVTISTENGNTMVEKLIIQ